MTSHMQITHLDLSHSPPGTPTFSSHLPIRNHFEKLTKVHLEHGQLYVNQLHNLFYGFGVVPHITQHAHKKECIENTKLHHT